MWNDDNEWCNEENVYVMIMKWQLIINDSNDNMIVMIMMIN